MKAKKRNLHFIDKVALWINVLLCLALLIGYLAPVTDPRKIWLIAFFGLAYPPVLLLNIIMIVYWLLRMRWPVVLSILTILVGWPVLNNNIGLRQKTTAKPRAINCVRMMTYNVHNFKRFGSTNDSSTRHAIFSLIDNEAPDVIGMQEFYSRKRGRYAMVDSLKKIMGDSSSYYFEPFNKNPEDATGIAVFSKYPIVNTGIIYLTENGNGNQCVFVDINKKGQRFRVYSVHLQSIRFDPEDYQYLDSVSKKGKTDMSSSRRIGGKLKRAFMKRSEQVATIRNHAAECKYPYIIAGDFNDTPSSFAVNQMAKGLKNAFREKGSGLGRTYNGDFPNYQIDFIMATKDFDVATYNIIEKKLSDHYAVRSDLLLKAKQ